MLAGSAKEYYQGGMAPIFLGTRYIRPHRLTYSDQIRHNLSSEKVFTVVCKGCAVSAPKFLWSITYVNMVWHIG